MEMREAAKKILDTPAKVAYYRAPGDTSGKIESDADHVSLCVAAEDIMLEACLRMSRGDIAIANKTMREITKHVRSNLLQLNNIKK